GPLHPTANDPPPIARAVRSNALTGHPGPGRSMGTGRPRRLDRCRIVVRAVRLPPLEWHVSAVPDAASGGVSGLGDGATASVERTPCDSSTPAIDRMTPA